MLVLPAAPFGFRGGRLTKGVQRCEQVTSISGHFVVAAQQTEYHVVPRFACRSADSVKVGIGEGSLPVSDLSQPRGADPKLLAP
jgi:hypothetical protein